MFAYNQINIIMKYKGFLRLTVQIAMLSISMILISFFTETQFWLDYFNIYFPEGPCGYGIRHMGAEQPEHYHWNYRGYVYSLTGLVYFGIAVFRITGSHDSGDFLKSPWQKIS